MMVTNRRSFLAIAILMLIPLMIACSPARDLSDEGPGETTPVAETETEPTPEPTPDPTPEPTPVPEAPTPEPTPDETPETDDGTPTSDSDADLTADEIIERASERTEELESVRFELESSGVLEIEGVGDVSLRSVEGAVEMPDRAEVEIAIQATGMAVPLTVVSIEGDIYYVDPFSGNWESAPAEFQFNPANIFSSEYGVPALLNSISEAELIGVAEVNGRDAWHIVALIDRETVDRVTGGMFSAEQDVDFEVWVDQETFDIVWVLLTDPTGETDTIWTIRIYDHNEPVEITDPRDL